MKDKFLYYISFAFQFLVEFYFLSLLSNKLTSDDFFHINYINYVLPYLIILVNFGTSYAVLYLSSYNLSKKIKDQANLINIYIAIAVIAISVLIYIITGKHKYLIAGCIVSLFYSIRQNYNSFYLASGMHKRAAVMRVSQKLLVLIFCIIYLSFEFVEIDFVLIYLFFEIIAFLGTLKINPLPNNFNTDKAKSIMKFAKFAFLSNLYGILFSALPVFLITENNYDKKTITSFFLSLTLLRYVASVLAPVFQIISPNITKKKSDKIFLKQYVKKYDFILLCFGTIIWLGVYLFGEVVLKFFYTQYDIYFYFKIISLAIPLLFVSSLQSSLISALGIVRKKNITELVILIVFTVVMVCIVKEYNLVYLSYIYVMYYLIKIVVNKIFIINPYLNTK